MASLKRVDLRIVFGLAILLAAASWIRADAQQPARGRPLAIEDYYRLQTVAAPSISPNGRWVVFAVSTRIEDDNSTRTETFVVPADASQARTRRALRQGRDQPSWTFDSRLEYAAERERWTVDPQNLSTPPARAAALPAGAVVSADTKWIAFAKDKPQPKTERDLASDFEKRHEERFKGVTFDWKEFQRDGAPFPAPNLRARPAAQIVVQPIGGGADRRCWSTGTCAPPNIAWHPDGQADRVHRRSRRGGTR